ncbi:Squalene/phytoene synthase-domain-containing protein [Mucor mucedo]|uniref:Squalene/phytoene synthase-domain-containing protein n=1 Tax=Mucor mucedo TaxID=29922 RepID=UPI00221FA557|nr:Squalene/phytoene synthase-domain-containing protein [Mucor mucedo]KAI7894108.1 Squalene/phytoene synthase-domain-containing protein [Mucor mucedo]
MDAIVYLLISIVTVSINGLLTRWQFPITFIKPRTNVYVSGLIRHGISTLLVVLAILSQASLNYTLSVTLAAISALWYISGPYFVRRIKVIGAVCSITSVLAYLLCLGASSYHGVCTSYSLYCLFPITLVFACNTLDHLDAILNAYPYLVNPVKSEQNLLQDPTTATYWFAILRLVMSMPSESELDPSPIDDLETAIRVLGPASRSWKTMAALFPVNLRQDLCLLYAFFRTADDLVDDAPTPAQCEANLVTIREFLKQVFDISMAKEQGDGHTALPSEINWDHYAGLLPNDDVLAIFRNFARISHYLCPRAMSELTDAWELDLRGEPVKKQNDLLNYAALISGTFGELCTCVIMYKTGNGNWGNTRNNNKARNDQVLSRARSTGQCLQLINIARDIIADSLVGRCYVPVQYMPYPQIYDILKVARNPSQVGEPTLKSFSLRILSLADQISDKAQKGIDGLPNEVQDSIRAAFEIYMAIGPTLRNDPGFPLRAKVPKRQQQWIALRCMYGFKGPVARAIMSTFYETISIYIRAFARISNLRTGTKTH